LQASDASRVTLAADGITASRITSKTAMIKVKILPPFPILTPSLKRRLCAVLSLFYLKILQFITKNTARVGGLFFYIGAK
jgi:hypothetical protein